MTRYSRRTLLRTGTTLVAGLAGCAGGRRDGGQSTTPASADAGPNRAIAGLLRRTPDPSPLGVYATGDVYYSRPRDVWESVDATVRERIAAGDRDVWRRHRFVDAAYRDRLEGVQVVPGVAVDRYALSERRLVDGLDAAGFEQSGMHRSFRLFSNPAETHGITRIAVSGSSVLSLDPWRKHGAPGTLLRRAVDAMDDDDAYAALPARSRRLVDALARDSGELTAVFRSGGRVEGLSVNYRRTEAVLTRYQFDHGERLVRSTTSAPPRPPFAYRSGEAPF